MFETTHAIAPRMFWLVVSLDGVKNDSCRLVAGFRFCLIAKKPPVSGFHQIERITQIDVDMLVSSDAIWLDRQIMLHVAPLRENAGDVVLRGDDVHRQRPITNSVLNIACDSVKFYIQSLL